MSLEHRQVKLEISRPRLHQPRSAYAIHRVRVPVNSSTKQQVCFERRVYKSVMRSSWLG
jgi:hypothetical protein